MPDHINNTSGPAAIAPGPNVALMHAAFPMDHGPASPPMPCDCDSETRRAIGNLTRHSGRTATPMPSGAASEPTPTKQQPMSLPDTLKTAHALVQHWGNLNGCPNAELHMNAPMLCLMTDAIGVSLRHHEVAVESMSSSARRRDSNTHPAEHGQRENVVTMPRALIGELELDPLEQAILVQESVKHSILRLAAMLQDIEEEAAAIKDQGESQLRNRGVKELITSLFRLLGSVNQIVPSE